MSAYSVHAGDDLASDGTRLKRGLARGPIDCRTIEYDTLVGNWNLDEVSLPTCSCEALAIHGHDGKHMRLFAQTHGSQSAMGKWRGLGDPSFGGVAHEVLPASLACFCMYTQYTGQSVLGGCLRSIDSVVACCV